MRLVLRTYVLLIFVFIFAPIVVSFVFSFSENRFPTLPLNGVSVDWYRKVFGESAIVEAFRRSVIAAVVTSFLSTFIGFGGAYIDYRYKFFGQRLYVAMGIVPPMIPVVILGVATLIFLTQISLSGALHSVIIAHVVLCVPFAMAINRLHLSQMEPNLEAAAWNLGANQWRTMRMVIIPYCMPALLASLFITAAISLDEFAIAWFVSGLEETLPVRVLNMVSRQATPSVNAIGSLTFTLSLTLVALAQIVLLFGRRRSPPNGTEEAFRG
jgi:spermidine/putrescine transport system permease protein